MQVYYCYNKKTGERMKVRGNNNVIKVIYKYKLINKRY